MVKVTFLSGVCVCVCAHAESYSKMYFFLGGQKYPITTLYGMFCLDFPGSLPPLLCFLLQVCKIQSDQDCVKQQDIF